MSVPLRDFERTRDKFVIFHVVTLLVRPFSAARLAIRLRSIHQVAGPWRIDVPSEDKAFRGGRLGQTKQAVKGKSCEFAAP